MFVFTVLLLCFFFSGATGLIYEVLWVRLLALTFGNTVYAIGIVLTAFMSGLSLGSLIFGRWADKGKNLLKAYGVLEFGIGLSALCSPLLLDWVTSFYLSLSIPQMPLWVLSCIRYSLSILVLLVPTTLMGGSLPVLSRFFIRTETELEKKIGSLYALNTIGGVLGTFLVGFILIRFLGISMTLKVTAFISIFIGAVSYMLGTKELMQEEQSPPEGCAVVSRVPGYRFALTAFFLSGFTAMVYEIAWSRLLIEVIGSTTYSFSIILICFLTGIGLGSLLVSFLSARKQLGLIHFSLIEILIGISCFSTLLFFPLLPPLMLKGLQITGNSYYAVLSLETLLVLFYMIVPTTLFGATFPVIAAVYSGGSEHRARNIGNIYASNTAGAIVGSSIAAFLLLPGLGSSLSIKAASVLNVGVGIAGLMILGKRRVVLLSLPALLVLLVLPVTISKETLVTGVAIYGKKSDFTLDSDQAILYFEEGMNANIAVVGNSDGSLTLTTNSKADGSTGGDMSTQLALAYFPLLLHAEPREILVIGYGTGVTVRAAAEFPGNAHIDSVEIEPSVMKTSDFFRLINHNADHSPNVGIIIDDARSHILTSRKQYDVIISEPSNPWISGIGNLFSKEFYLASLAKLNKAGIFCQWVHLYNIRSEEVQMIIRTFSSVFPETAIWHSTPADIILLGSRDNMSSGDYNVISQRMKGSLSRDLMAYLHISDPVDFYAYYITGTEGVKAISSRAMMNTDDKPLLEFHAPFSLYTDTFSDNYRLLLQQMRVPSVRGYPGTSEFEEEYFFRKALIYQKMGLFEHEWISRLHEKRRAYIVNREVAVNPAYPDRREALRKALDYSSVSFPSNYEDTELLYAAIRIELEKGDIGKAHDYLKRAENTPQKIVDQSQLYYDVGVYLSKLGKLEEGINYLKRSVEVNPHHFKSFLLLGDSYARIGTAGPACESYRTALNLAAKNMRGEVLKRISANCKEQ